MGDKRQAFVVMKLTRHISSACEICWHRNNPNEGFVELTLWKQVKAGHDSYSNAESGYVLYCVDCYEMLRGLAADDFGEFRPFYELVYEKELDFDFPPELLTSKRDPLHLWRRRIDKAAWLTKLAERRKAEANT
jgi:hypothetical protein